ncbi:unnamed protein product [Adineta ricciae]|uniref:Uncharacterized protein n=1 Tax=Adineta ricciae TaxID=249248 RepID=A0A815UG32_ADIRI|nr:unnamed protein product [Adineta ricciae]
MDEKQPLLKSASKLSHNDDGDKKIKEAENNSFVEWCQSFNGGKNNDNYKKLNDKVKNEHEDHHVSIMQMFRHSDGISILLMIICAVFVLLNVICILGTSVLFAIATGVFVTESFNTNWADRLQNLTILASNYNSICPPVTRPDSLNYDQLYTFYQFHNTTITPTKLLVVSSLRQKLMPIVHWLLVTTIVTFLSVSLQYFIWSIAIKRQTTRMNILLFKSLLQRVSKISRCIKRMLVLAIDF